MPLWTLKLIKIEFYDLSGIVNIQLLIDFLLDRYYNTFDIFLNSFPPIDRHKLKIVTNQILGKIEFQMGNSIHGYIPRIAPQST